MVSGTIYSMVSGTIYSSRDSENWLKFRYVLAEELA